MKSKTSESKPGEQTESAKDDSVQRVVMTTPTIPHKPLPPEIPPAWTVNQLLHHIPEHWRGVVICLLDGLGRPYPVKKVVLTVNHDGSMVVMLGPQEQVMHKWSYDEL